MAKVCKKCEATLDDAGVGHFGGCEDHPTNIALRKRVSAVREEPSNDAVVKVAGDADIRKYSTTPKFVLPPAEMILPEDTIKKAMEYFMQGAMGLNVEVTGFKSEVAINTSNGLNGYTTYKVSFKGKE